MSDTPEHALPEQPRAKTPRIVLVAMGLILLVGLFVADATWVYTSRSHGAFSRVSARLLPLPAALVQGRPVWLSNVFADARGFLAWQEMQKNVMPDERLGWEEIEQNVLARHVEMAQLAALAQERGIAVTDAEVDAEFAKTSDPAIAEMRKALGWSERDFKKNVIAVYLLRNRLAQTLGTAVLDAELAKKEGVVLLWRVE